MHTHPENTGSFTTFAQSLGLSVKEAAAYVMANKHQFPHERVQQANFIRRNAKVKHQQGGMVNPTTENDNNGSGSFNTGYARNNFFNRLLNRNNILEQQIRNEYGALKKIPLRKLHVDYADGADAETLKQLQRKVEFVGPEEGTRQVQFGSITIPKGKMLVDDNPLNPKFISVRYPGQYTTVLDPQGKPAREIKAEVANDFVSHALNSDPAYRQLTSELENLLVNQYGQHTVEGNGGVDAYVRGLISDLSEYQPYKDEMAFVPQPLKDKITNYIRTGSLPRSQNGGAVDRRFLNFLGFDGSDPLVESITYEQPRYVSGGMSALGYKHNSPDRFNEFNIIPSNHITMQNVPHPVWGVDNTGASQLMMPGNDYLFPGQTVFEVPVRPGQLSLNNVHGQPPTAITQSEKNYKQNGGPINMSNSRKPIPRRRARYNSNAYMQSGGQPGYPLFPMGVNYVFPGQDAFTYPEAFQIGGEPTPRLVDTVPQDYHPYGQYQGRPTFARDSGVTMPLATGHGSGGAQYDQFLMNKLASGVSPEELARKKYIHPSQVERFRQYYKPSRDVVYTQPPVPPPPPPVPTDHPVSGSSSVRLYDNRGHAYADAFYPSRSSSGQADPGTLNTAKQPARLQLLDRMGQYIPDQVYEVPGNVLDDMTGGTHSVHDTTGLSQYRVPSGNLSGRFQTGGQPRLVDQIPAGYQPDGQYQGRPTYSKDMGANLPMANGNGGQGGPAYEQFLIKQLAAGVTPEELAKKRYIAGDPNTLANYQRYFKPSRDVVYMQPPVPPPPAPADYPTQGYFNHDLYFPNKHLAAVARTGSRNSRGQADPGMLNTATQPTDLMFVDNMGRIDPSKGRYIIPHDVYSNQMTHGTNVLQDTTGLSQYRVPAGNLSGRYQVGGGYGPFFFRYL